MSQLPAVLAALALSVLLTPKLNASNVTASAHCGQTGGPNSDGGSLTAGQAATASIANLCESWAIADYGVLKTYTSASYDGNIVGGGGSSEAYARLSFYLSDLNALPNQTIQLTIPIQYHVTLVANDGSGAPNNSNGVSWIMARDYSGVYLVRLQSTTDVFGANLCPAPIATLPSCNGTYEGTINIGFTAYLNAWNSFDLRIGGSVFHSGIADAANTVTIGNTILPNGVTFAYDGPSGNPMSFQYAVDSTVPEPATAALAAISLLAGLCVRRRSQTAR